MFNAEGLIGHSLISRQEQQEATELFQAIAAAYEELLQPEPGQLRRVKSRVAAAAEWPATT